MFDEQPDRYEDDQPVWRRIGVPAILVLCVCSAGALGYVLLKPSGGPAPRPHMEQHITQVQLPPPPPPPPPKPQPEPPKKQMEKPKEQAPSPQKASVPKAAPKAPSPPAAVTTSIQGNGPGSLANGNGGGGDCIGSGCGTGDGGGGDNDAYYSSIMKSQIEAAIRQDEKLKFARYRVKVSVVLDASGHVARASVQSFTGDADIEQELKRVLLTVGTNDTPPPDVIRKTFTISIVEHV